MIRRFPCIARFALVLLMAGQAQAAIVIDLSYVDMQSTAYARFKAFVDAAVAGNPGYAFTATDAAMLFRITGQAQYATLAVQTAEAQVAAAEAAMAGGNRPEIAGDSYLHVGPMLMDVALTMDWCAAAVTPAQRTRWSAYAERAVWNVWHPAQAQWGGHAHPWSGWGTDNPANNYYYSFVQATMFWGLASNSTTWRTLLDTDKLPTLTAYFTGLAGGGSQEGTGYGLSHRTVFFLERVWRDSTGVNLAAANGHLDASIAWWIHATVPTLDKVAPIGDQSRVSEPVLYDYHRELLLAARAMSTDTAARDDASWWLGQISQTQMQSGFNFRHDLLPAGSGGTPPATLFHHAPATGQFFTRTGWDRGALWLNVSAGPYRESHAHQDQGGFTLYENDWLAVTENIWTHSGIQQGTDAHNVLRFEHAGGIIPQRTGTTSTMMVTTAPGGAAHVVADLTPAYAGHAAISSWQRTFDFAQRRLVVTDAFSVASGTQAVFQVNTPVQPIISGRTAVAGNLMIRVVAPTHAVLTALDWTTLTGPEETYHRGWRLDVRGGGNSYVVEFTTPNTDRLFTDGFES